MKNGEARPPQCELTVPLETVPCSDDEIITSTGVQTRVLLEIDKGLRKTKTTHSTTLHI